MATPAEGTAHTSATNNTYKNHYNINKNTYG